MSVTQAKWNEELCRVENGVFFATDQVVLLEGHPADGYRAAAPVPLSTLIDGDPDGWTDLVENPGCQVAANGLIISAGATAWEGEGFIAVHQAATGDLIWLLHLCESEAFVKLRLDGDAILAISTAYPESYRWRIPLHDPAQLRVSA
jgi:hypothetical protein